MHRLEHGVAQAQVRPGHQPQAADKPGTKITDHIAEQVLGRAGQKNCYYRVGYCPVVVEGNFAKATTLLYPGYCGTPEYGLILQSGFGREEREKLISTASGMTRAVLEQTQDISLMKWFHENGVPQVIETDEDYFGRIIQSD